MATSELQQLLEMGLRLVALHLFYFLFFVEIHKDGMDQT